MRRPSLLVLLVAIAALSGAATAADKVTLTGIISDEICTAKHGLPDPVDCVHQCVERGADWVLVAKDKVYTIKPDNTDALASLDKLAGQAVTIVGEPEADFIWVLTVTAAKK